jgi:hypothetical protein
MSRHLAQPAFLPFRPFLLLFHRIVTAKLQMSPLHCQGGINRENRQPAVP